jgi:predicted  nucleic acid-binding Zn-ribbon protein
MANKPKTNLITRDMIADRNRLSAEVENARRELVTAEQRVATARADVERIESQTSADQYASDAMRAANRALSASNNALTDAKTRVRNAEREYAKVSSICDAPDALTRAEAELDDATETRTNIENALAEIISRQAAMTAKETAIAGRIADTDSANAAKAISDEPLDLASAVRLEAERRAVRSALAQLAEQAASLTAQREEAIGRQQTARDEIRHHATTVTELELAAALRAVLPLAAKLQIMRNENPRRIEIDIPDEVVAQVEREIVAPSADR